MRWKPNLLLGLFAPYLIIAAIVATGLYVPGDRVIANPYVLWAALVVLALAGLWPALVVSRRMSRRLARLTRFSRAVAADAVAPELVPEGDDALGRLEANLLAMANSLRAQLHVAEEEKAKLEAVLSGMVEGVLVVDRAGTVRLSNHRADQLFGSSPSTTLMGQPLINVSRDPDLQDLVRAALDGEPGRRLVREIRLKAAGGEVFQVTASPILEPDGALHQLILVFHDVTELKRLETTRRDFVANVSHELRTPLTAIRGYAETLLAGAIDNPELARKFLGVIERHSARLSRLTDDLLILSDLELGRAALQPVPMKLAPVVDAAIDTLREKARQGEVMVRREVTADLPQLRAAPDRIEQVLVNLIDNAVKFTPAGGEVTVRACVSERLGTEPPASGKPNPWVEISVADTGIGIPSNELPRLSERFYRVDKARSRELGGTGLGLAIVKHIVQLHAGVLHIDSTLGQGTCVRVYLPTVAAAAGQ